MKYKKDWSVNGPVTVTLIVNGFKISDYKRDIIQFPSLYDALLKYRYQIENPTNYFYSYHCKVYDEYGFEIPRWKIDEVIRQSKFPYAYKAWWARKRRFKYRQGPVESIRSHSRWGGYRIPHTQPELRENDFIAYDDDCLEYDIKVRPCRRRSAIPNSYDDFPRNREKNWKRQRKTQWKA